MAYFPFKNPAKSTNQGWDRFERALQKHGPRTYATLNPPATPTTFDKLEAALGFPLPDDFRSFYSRHDGQTANDETPGVFDWFFLPLDEIGTENVLSEWQAALALVKVEPYGQFEGPVKRCTWNARWIPFGIDYRGNALCFDFDPLFWGRRGQIVCVDYDLNVTGVIAKSVALFLKLQAERLEERERVIVEGTLLAPEETPLLDISFDDFTRLIHPGKIPT